MLSHDADYDAINQTEKGSFFLPLSLLPRKTPTAKPAPSPPWQPHGTCIPSSCPAEFCSNLCLFQWHRNKGCWVVFILRIQSQTTVSSSAALCMLAGSRSLDTSHSQPSSIEAAHKNMCSATEHVHFPKLHFYAGANGRRSFGKRQGHHLSKIICKH